VRPRALLPALAVALTLLAAAPARAADEERMTIPTRPGVTDSFLLDRPAGAPVASVVLYTGGNGVLRKTMGNFLIRSRLDFAAEGLLVAAVEAPSDRPTGLVQFRTSAEHAEDARAVIAALRKIADVPVWLVGTSMGTVSAASVAARLTDGGPDGIVLTSTVTRWSKLEVESTNDVDLRAIRVPVLIVHHEQDGCFASPPSGAALLPRQLVNAPVTRFLEVTGGDPPRSGPCDALAAHGYLGIEKRVVAAIAKFIRETPPRR
jgi:pimeloyl-ACP methyl ester carboxylesterase